MDEMVNANGMNLVSVLSGMSSGDKAFLGLLGAMVVAYLGKLYFENVGKAMEHGYDVTITSSQNGSMRFSRGPKEIDGQEEIESEEAENGAN